MKNWPGFLKLVFETLVCNFGVVMLDVEILEGNEHKTDQTKQSRRIEFFE